LIVPLNGLLMARSLVDVFAVSSYLL
jgi:hypothetical protein